MLHAHSRFISAICIDFIFMPHWCNTWILLAFINIFLGEGHYSALWRCLKCAELDVDALIACIKLVGNTVINLTEQIINIFMFGRNWMYFVFPDEWFISVKKQFSINQGVFQLQPAPCVCGLIKEQVLFFVSLGLLLETFHHCPFQAMVSPLIYHAILQIFSFSKQANIKTGKSLVKCFHFTCW